jgi:HK97 family phage major capsid protein
MSATDAMVARLQNEIEERRTFQNLLVEGAQEGERDLNDQEMALYQSATDHITGLSKQLGPLQEGVRIASESAQRSRELSVAIVDARDGKRPTTIEYRTAGEYIIDKWQAGAGSEEAKARLTMYERAAAHQTTQDNLGLIPEPVVGTVIQRIDASRPVVTALGPQGVPSGMFKRPRVTQHTQVGPQNPEKTELASRKMLITEVPVTMATYGGYVNVSRQNIDWSSPSIMDIVVNDLASEYAITTEGVACNILETNATAQTPALPATPTSAQVSTAIWQAAGAA